MNIGRLVPGAEPGTFIGNIVTRTLGLRLMMRRNGRHKANDANSPKYELFSIEKHGEVAIGMAWEKTPRDGGAPFLSIAIDDPSFDAPLNVSAFGDGDGFNIVWQRPKLRPENFVADRGPARDADIPL
jgi:uncharacterized protein (DUF736 family)